VYYVLGEDMQSKADKELKKVEWTSSPWNNMEFSISGKPEPMVIGCKRCKHPK